MSHLSNILDKYMDNDLYNKSNNFEKITEISSTNNYTKFVHMPSFNSFQDFYYTESFNYFSGFNVNFLYLIGGLAILSGILIVVSKNPIYSVLYLIFLFSNISCYLIFVGIVFIGLSYLLVYVGAVSILFLFILMLINIRVSELIGETNNNIPLAILAILAFFIPISNILPSENSKSDNILQFLAEKETNVLFVSSNNWDNSIIDISDITSIGNVMYTSYYIWLMITSVILLLAMVGSIVITIKQNSASID